jgi:hypothetical protein
MIATKRALLLGLTSMILLLASVVQPYPYDSPAFHPYIGNYDPPECARTGTCTELCLHDYEGKKQCLVPHEAYERDQ